MLDQKIKENKKGAQSAFFNSKCKLDRLEIEQFVNPAFNIRIR